MLGQASDDLRPGISKVGGFVDEGIPVVDQVEIDTDVRGTGIEMGRLDACDRAPSR